MSECQYTEYSDTDRLRYRHKDRQTFISVAVKELVIRVSHHACCCCCSPSPGNTDHVTWWLFPPSLPAAAGCLWCHSYSFHSTPLRLTVSHLQNIHLILSHIFPLWKATHSISYADQRRLLALHDPTTLTLWPQNAHVFLGKHCTESQRLNQ